MVERNGNWISISDVRDRFREEQLQQTVDCLKLNVHFDCFIQLIQTPENFQLAFLPKSNYDHFLQCFPMCNDGDFFVVCKLPIKKI